MKKKTVEIKRSASYFVVNKYALRLLKQKHSGAERVKLITLYNTLLWMADDIGEDKVIFYNNGIRTYSGLPKEWITQGLKTLEKDGLIKKKIRKIDGKYKGLIITIEDYFSSDDKAHSPESRIPETRNSEFQKTVPGFSATKEDYTKETLLPKGNSDLKKSQTTKSKNNSNSSISEKNQKEKNSAKKEKGARREDLDNLDDWLKDQLKRTGWEDTYKVERNSLSNILKLKKKLGAEEFIARVNYIKKDKWQLEKRCGSLVSVYRILKATPVQTKSIEGEKPKKKFKDSDLITLEEITELYDSATAWKIERDYKPEEHGPLTYGLAGKIYRGEI